MSTDVWANAYTPTETAGLFSLVDEFPAVNGEGPTSGVYNGAALSDDGRYVAFSSDNPDGVGPAQMLRKDLTTGALACVSCNADLRPSDADSGVRPSGANNWYRQIAISGDGRNVAFTSMAQNLTRGANGNLQVYRKDMSTGDVTLMSTSDGGAAVANQPAGQAGVDISDTGRVVAFATMATNLVTGDGAGLDWFVRNTTTAATIEVSKRVCCTDGSIP